ncbi:MAG: tRNA dimethylallyltransferase [Chlamydiales bacterium]|nr:tRNA dimethylallyltransferase [Chlamydiales bacterium]MCH9635389.1 tRNA dimethylallyltransferase [Chlamydiales bacterium]
MEMDLPVGQKATSPLGSLLPLEKKIREFRTTKPGKVILIAGPTACGKTALSLLLADMLHGEVVSCDSMQVYRGMDIGTAKISKREQDACPHHLIDIRNVQENFNVVDFYHEARQCVDAILARNRTPILVGGTGFYFRAFLYGPPSGPPSLPDMRRALEGEMKQHGSQPLFDRLREFDPEYASTITPNDKHKIIRGLEIIILTGEKVSSLRWQREHPLPDYEYHCWFLHRPRKSLYKLIDSRCEQMLEFGLLDEVKELERQGLRLNPSASQAIGYRQCLDYLDGAQNEERYEEMVKKFKQASRQYAKRQFTWFKKEPLFEWLDIDAHDLEIAAETIAKEFQSTC